MNKICIDKIKNHNIEIQIDMLVIATGGLVVMWLRDRPGDRRVSGSIPDSIDFLTNSFGQATNALVFLFTKQ